VSEILNLAKAFNWQNPSWDLFIFLFWTVASVIYAFTSGRGRIINILFSVYIAKLLTLEAPFLTTAIENKLPENLAAVQQLVSFVILFLALFFFLGRFAFRTSADGRHLGSLVFGLIFAVLQIGLLINIILTFLPVDIQQNFGELVRVLFIGQTASFVWLLAPLGFLIVLGRHISDGNEI
jgi:hypothetical protein